MGVTEFSFSPWEDFSGSTEPALTPMRMAQSFLPAISTRKETLSFQGFRRSWW